MTEEQRQVWADAVQQIAQDGDDGETAMCIPYALVVAVNADLERLRTQLSQIEARAQAIVTESEVGLQSCCLFALAHRWCGIAAEIVEAAREVRG